MASDISKKLTDEELMELLKKRVLEENTHILSERLEPKTHLPRFISRFILSRDECEDIGNQHTRKRRADRFLELLSTKGQKAYDCLIESIIEDKTQLELAKSMNISLEKQIKKAFVMKHKVQNTGGDSDEDLPTPPTPINVTGARYSTSLC